MYTLKRYSKKVMIEKKMISVAMQERFILQKLQCPFITSICYAFQDNHFIYLVTDYADTSFEKVLKSNRVGEGQLRIFAAELVLALQHLHSKFIIYRYLYVNQKFVARDNFNQRWTYFTESFRTSSLC
jgi:serine/threonine protein kinase